MNPLWISSQKTVSKKPARPGGNDYVQGSVVELPVAITPCSGLECRLRRAVVPGRIRSDAGVPQAILAAEQCQMAFINYYSPRNGRICRHIAQPTPLNFSFN